LQAVEFALSMLSSHNRENQSKIKTKRKTKRKTRTDSDEDMDEDQDNSLLFDDYHPIRSYGNTAEMNRLYWKNDEWLQQYNDCTTSLTKLYIFADRYAVHQLRDNIMTAICGRALAWDWWPDPDEDFLRLAYDNLPASCQLIRFFVIEQATLGITSGDVETNMKNLHSWNSEFYMQVTMLMAKRLEAVDNRKREADIVEFEDLLPNSCAVHEHMVLDKDACRERLANRMHIFKGLLDACS
jgi:hypothetical protein